ncbi:iron chelate uptake ABC transporter family permease subunit [Saccharomonospora amisosensis]|uniref:iron chelate uptake ABC transporter family permease subunit n=1 Tax=Saccharomonospora amisosensis TaxID=1128677 RepID=UPI001ABAA657
MALGEELAKGLRQNINHGRLRVLTAAVLLASGATALVGPIAFAGLLVPHLATRRHSCKRTTGRSRRARTADRPSRHATPAPGRSSGRMPRTAGHLAVSISGRTTVPGEYCW